MSILEKDKVDGLATNNNGKTLMILLSDHLDWQDEEKHLLSLQDKINAYIVFIENKQYKSIYPDNTFENIIIEIHFKHKITNNCKKFINVVNEQIKSLNTECTIVES